MRTQRTGARQKRDRREIARIPDLGYYIIITDTERTEVCFSWLAAEFAKETTRSPSDKGGEYQHRPFARIGRRGHCL